MAKRIIVSIYHTKNNGRNLYIRDYIVLYNLKQSFKILATYTYIRKTMIFCYTKKQAYWSIVIFLIFYLLSKTVEKTVLYNLFVDKQSDLKLANFYPSLFF